MSQTVNATSSPTRLPHQPIRLLWAYLGLTFALAWAACVPAAVFFSNTDRPGLPAFAGTLFVLQTLGAAAPTIAAYLVLRASGRRDLFAWIASRYRIWRVHPGWYLVAGLLAPAITLLSWGSAPWPTPTSRSRPAPRWPSCWPTSAWAGRRWTSRC
jgi:hypothetical protein